MDDRKAVQDRRLRAAAKGTIRTLEGLLSSEDVMICSVAGAKIESIISRLTRAAGEGVTVAKKTTKTKKAPVADPEGMNPNRAEWARAAVQAFQNETGLGEEDGLDTAISDLLADIAHLCDAEGLDFGHLLYRADNHYTEETSSEGSENAEEVDGAQFNRIDVERAAD